MLDVAQIFTKTIDHLDAIMQNEGIDSAVLIDQLEQVQGLISATLTELAGGAGDHGR